MRPDDFGRLGELMRRGGVWRGRRLLSASTCARGHAVGDERLLRLADLAERGQAVHRPDGHRARRSRTAATSPTCPPTSTASPACSASSSRCSRRRRSSSCAPARTPASCPPARRAGSTSCTSGCSRAITDQKIEPPGDAPRVTEASEDRHGLRLPDRARRARPVLEGREPGPLPPAGPARARAAIFGAGREERQRARRRAREARLPATVA